MVNVNEKSIQDALANLSQMVYSLLNVIKSQISDYQKEHNLQSVNMDNPLCDSAWAITFDDFGCVAEEKIYEIRVNDAGDLQIALLDEQWRSVMNDSYLYHIQTLLSIADVISQHLAEQ